MEKSQVGTIFKVLADENRREMVKLLGESERTVGELEKSLGLSQSSTSQHLKLLHQAGLVDFRKYGTFRIYSLKTKALKEAMHYFDNLWDEGLARMKNNLEQNDG